MRCAQGFPAAALLHAVPRAEGQQRFHTVTRSLCPRRAFLLQPGPGTGPIQCVVTRQRRGAKLFPEYTMHLEVCHRFLLAARKRKKSASTHYLLSSDSRARREFCSQS